MDIESLINTVANIKLNGATFKCPYCGKEYDIKDAVVEKILASSEHTSTKIRGRKITYTYIDSYYYVRFCAKCHKRKTATKKVIFGSIFITAFIYFVINIFKNGSFEDGLDIMAFILIAFMLYFLLRLVVGVILWVLDKTIYAVDFEEAHKNNAIEPHNPI